MIEVHPPEHRIGGFRDFLIHLLTITVGLLIALGLENIAEWAHHRHQRNEAEENIRLELADNQRDLATLRKHVEIEKADLLAILEFAKAKANGETKEIKSGRISFAMNSPRSASWQIANSTGAVSYMYYERAQRFANVYQLQEQFVQLERLTFDDFLKLQSYAASAKPEAASADDAKQALPLIRQTIAHLYATDQYAAVLQTRYEHALADKD